jgi:monofunctional biosynthetic peptidoglycan transglycosylase
LALVLPEPAPLAPPADQALEPASVAPVPAPVPRRRRRLLLAVAAVLVAGAAWQAITWPDVGALAKENPDTTAFIERWKRRQARAGRRDAEPRWRQVPYARISPHLKRAVLVAEDIEFFAHHGFSTREQRQALRDAWEERRLPRGASTLTQQLAKNLWLSPSRNPLRKLEEALLTVQLERRLPKRRILELYLNVVEFGPGIYGAEAAARHYYGVSAAGLSEGQAAALAAGLPRPATWHPGAASRSYQRRVRSVLRRMARARFLWNEI